MYTSHNGTYPCARVYISIFDAIDYSPDYCVVSREEIRKEKKRRRRSSDKVTKMCISAQAQASSCTFLANKYPYAKLVRV